MSGFQPLKSSKRRLFHDVFLLLDRPMEIRGLECLQGKGPSESPFTHLPRQGDGNFNFFLQRRCHFLKLFHPLTPTRGWKR